MTPRLLLQRIRKTEHATIGLLWAISRSYPPLFLAYTLENPDRDGAPDDRIPEGVYSLKLWTMETHPHSDYARICRDRYGLPGVVETAGIKGRSACLNHWGVHEGHTEGCTLLGLGIIWNAKTERWELQSAKRDKAAWRRIGGHLCALAGDGQGQIIIRNAPERASELGLDLPAAYFDDVGAGEKPCAPL